ncbi:hypothetical protein [Nonomuraea sp. NPDC048901]|uniref:hypothetical protein n=1 Tax=Nonomuraea sp. NPDC048901 TaxID=3155627 RepID=UPI0033D87709
MKSALIMQVPSLRDTTAPAPGDGEEVDVEDEAAAKGSNADVEAEFTAMRAVHDVLDSLKNPAAQRRVLGWATAMFADGAR